MNFDVQISVSSSASPGLPLAWVSGELGWLANVGYAWMVRGMLWRWPAVHLLGWQTRFAGVPGVAIRAYGVIDTFGKYRE
jgi:hypothetical protein